MRRSMDECSEEDGQLWIQPEKEEKILLDHRNENLVLSGIILMVSAFGIFFDGGHGGKIGFLCTSNRTQLVVNYFDKE